MFKFAKASYGCKEFCILPSSDIASSRFCHWIKASLNSARCLNEELKYRKWDLPCGSVVENPTCSWREHWFDPGSGGSHRLGSNQTRVSQLLATLSSGLQQRVHELGASTPSQEASTMRRLLPTVEGSPAHHNWRSASCTAPNAQRGPSPKTQETAWGL